MSTLGKSLNSIVMVLATPRPSIREAEARRNGTSGGQEGPTKRSTLGALENSRSTPACSARCRR